VSIGCIATLRKLYATPWNPWTLVETLDDTVLEIVPNGEHVMTDLVGKGFMQKLDKLRTK